ncbi:MAG: hypothetical protein ACE5I5_18200 [Candidatus Heimdallarchaeota archaeon]
MKTRGRLVTPVFFVAGRSTAITRACAAPAASGSILTTGTDTLVFACCCPHYNCELCKLWALVL